MLLPVIKLEYYVSYVLSLVDLPWLVVGLLALLIGLLRFFVTLLNDSLVGNTDIVLPTFSFDVGLFNYYNLLATDAPR